MSKNTGESNAVVPSRRNQLAGPTPGNLKKLKIHTSIASEGARAYIQGGPNWTGSTFIVYLLVTTESSRAFCCSSSSTTSTLSSILIEYRLTLDATNLTWQMTIDHRNSLTVNLGHWIQWWCQNLDRKCTNSRFCGCAVKIWQKNRQKCCNFA